MRDPLEKKADERHAKRCPEAFLYHGSKLSAGGKWHPHCFPMHADSHGNTVSTKLPSGL